MTEKYFVHCRDAYLAEKRNPKALGDAVASLLNNQKLRKKISRNGLKFLDRNGFRNKVAMEKVMEVFENVVRSPTMRNKNHIKR